MAEQIVRICANCQKEQGLEPAMKDAVKAGLRFSHGVCLRHMEGMIKAMGLDDATARRMMDKAKAGNPVPDLSEHPDLVKMYKQGIWLPQQLQQKQQPEQPQVQPLKESTDFTARLKKLAGIKS